MSTRFVSYLRRSTGKQPLSIETQRAAVAALVGLRGEIVGEYVETMSGKRDDRPELARAIAHAKAARAVLICAKLDRLGRRAAFTLGLLDDAKKSGIEVLFADNPTANTLTLGVMAVVAEEEARAISARTKASLAAARERGTKLGCPNGAAALRRYEQQHGNAAGCDGARHAADEFASEIKFAVEDALQAGAMTLAAVADALNAKGFPSRRGGRWHAASAGRLLHRLGLGAASGNEVAA